MIFLDSNFKQLYDPSLKLLVLPGFQISGTGSFVPHWPAAAGFVEDFSKGGADRVIQTLFNFQNGSGGSNEWDTLINNDPNLTLIKTQVLTSAFCSSQDMGPVENGHKFILSCDYSGAGTNPYLRITSSPSSIATISNAVQLSAGHNDTLLVITNTALNSFLMFSQDTANQTDGIVSNISLKKLDSGNHLEAKNITWANFLQKDSTGLFFRSDGSDDLLTIPTNIAEDFNPHLNNFTCLIMFRKSSPPAAYKAIMGRYGPTATNGAWDFGILNNGVFDCSIRADTTDGSSSRAQSLISVCDGSWHILGVKRENEILRVYLDGIETDSDNHLTGDYNLDCSQRDFSILSRTGTSEFINADFKGFIWYLTNLSDNRVLSISNILKGRL